jgi:adenylate cyclase
MDTANFSELRTWLTEAGLAGESETALLDGFCRRALDAGVPIARCHSDRHPAPGAMRDEGMSDVAAMITRFPRSGAIGEMDSLYSYWATDRPNGFNDAQVEAIAGLMPMLALAVKCVSLARIAGTLVETYLGLDAGQRVLRGLIRRGDADRISAVLWYSDLR